MEKTKKGALIKKFSYAFKGFFIALKEEKSLVIHIIVAFFVFIIAIILRNQLNTTEWAIISIVVALVISTELINTAIENLCDFVSFKFNSKAKKIKDVAAAATLIIAIASIAVGCLIFIPNIKEFIESLNTQG